MYISSHSLAGIKGTWYVPSSVAFKVSISPTESRENRRLYLNAFLPFQNMQYASIRPATRPQCSYIKFIMTAGVYIL